MDQSTPIVRKAKWLSVIEQCQKRPIDMTVRQWLADNGISEKSYYYWLRKFCKEVFEKAQLPSVRQSSEISFAEISVPDIKPVVDDNCLVNSSAVSIIRIKDISIELTNDVSNDLFGRILEGINLA